MSDEPSAPATDGDDEFAGLAPPRRGKSPILAAAVIALSALILWHLRADITYAFASRQPTALGDARTLQSRGVALGDNRYVTVAGQAERRYALWIEPRGERTRDTIFRLLGAGTRLFVRAGDTSDRVDFGEQWTGRLRRFDALPYAEALRKYYATETHVTRSLDLKTLRARLEGGAAGLRDRMGEPIEVAAAQPLVVDVAYPGELKLWLSKDKYPSLADARHELVRMKLDPSPGEESAVEYAFVIPLPEARKTEILDLLSAQGITFQPRRERYDVPLSALRLDGDTAHVGDKATVPWAQLDAVGVPTPVEIGPDSYILIEGETPSSFWWAPLLALLLLAFSGFNVWYLVRSFRRA